MNLHTMKIQFLKQIFNVILLGYDGLSIEERLEYLWKSIMTFAPIAFLLDTFNLWFNENTLFFTSVVLFIFINMIMGAYMHHKKGSFIWQELLKKTMTMIVVVMISYLIMALLFEVAGHNFIVDTFETTVQVATLLYPGSKILKNVFILSKGEHPPKWVMEKIYNFQQNGDLAEFLKNKDEVNEDTISDEDV